MKLIDRVADGGGILNCRKFGPLRGRERPVRLPFRAFFDPAPDHVDLLSVTLCPTWAEAFVRAFSAMIDASEKAGSYRGLPVRSELHSAMARTRLLWYRAARPAIRCFSSGPWH